MPVHHRVSDGVLFVTVDGDFTPEEFRRKGDDALFDPDLVLPARVLLDMSGAAGLDTRSVDALRTTATLFARRADRIFRVAVLAPDDLAFGLMRMTSTFAVGAGLEAQAFRTRAEAMAWLGAAAGT